MRKCFPDIWNFLDLCCFGWRVTNNTTHQKHIYISDPILFGFFFFSLCPKYKQINNNHKTQNKQNKIKQVLPQARDSRIGKTIKENLYKESIEEADNSSDIENSICYERFTHCIHALPTLPTMFSACPWAFISIVNFWEAQTLNHTQKVILMSIHRISQCHLSLWTCVFSVSTGFDHREVLFLSTEFSYFVRK